MLARFIYGSRPADHNRRVVFGGISGLLPLLAAIILLEKTDTPYGHELGGMSADACEIVIAIVGGMLFCLLGFAMSAHLSFYMETQQSRIASAENVWLIFLMSHRGENEGIWRWAIDNHLLKDGINDREIDPDKLLIRFPTPNFTGWERRSMLNDIHLIGELRRVILPAARQWLRDEEAAQEAARAQHPN